MTLYVDGPLRRGVRAAVVKAERRAVKCCWVGCLLALRLRQLDQLRDPGQRANALRHCHCPRHGRQLVVASCRFWAWWVRTRRGWRGRRRGWSRALSCAASAVASGGDAGVRGRFPPACGLAVLAPDGFAEVYAGLTAPLAVFARVRGRHARTAPTPAQVRTGSAEVETRRSLLLRIRRSGSRQGHEEECAAGKGLHGRHGHLASTCLRLDARDSAAAEYTYTLCTVQLDGLREGGRQEDARNGGSSWRGAAAV